MVIVLPDIYAIFLAQGENSSSILNTLSSFWIVQSHILFCNKDASFLHPYQNMLPNLGLSLFVLLQTWQNEG